MLRVEENVDLFLESDLCGSVDCGTSGSCFNIDGRFHCECDASASPRQTGLRCDISKNFSPLGY